MVWCVIAEANFQNEFSWRNLILEIIFFFLNKITKHTIIKIKIYFSITKYIITKYNIVFVLFFLCLFFFYFFYFFGNIITTPNPLLWNPLSQNPQKIHYIYKII